MHQKMVSVGGHVVGMSVPHSTAIGPMGVRNNKLWLVTLFSDSLRCSLAFHPSLSDFLALKVCQTPVEVREAVK
jgi:hypothetical protein